MFLAAAYRGHRPGGADRDRGCEHRETVQRLDNGLQVVIQRNTRSPLVAVVTRVGAGYLNEEEDEAGVSHLLEHMILQGTRSHSSAAEMSAQLRALGARVNAATTYDHTESWMVLPAAQAEGGIQLAGEIYSEPLLDPAVMEVEKRRVREEILRKLEDPVAFARDELLQLIYSDHSMGRGSEEILAQLDAITIEQLQRFHDDHYRPTNTTLTVVGDVDPAALLVQIEQAFGGVERGNLRLHAGPAPPRPDALHYAAFRGNYDPNLVMVGFPLPGEGHADLPALELLSAILVDGQASRMRLPLERRNDIVFELESRVVRYEGEGLFEILIAAPDKRRGPGSTHSLRPARSYSALRRGRV